MKTINPSTFATILTRTLRAGVTASALVLVGSLAFAQQGESARPVGGAGLTFNFGGILNALKNSGNRSNPNQPPVLQKRADSVGTPSGGNYTVNWVISYANTSTQTLANAMVRDGPIATIIPGSLQQPAGWSPGVTNATPLPANNWAQWIGASVPPHGVMTATFPVSSGGSTVGGNGADGYIPIPYNSIAFGPRVYMLNHGVNRPTLFQCVNATSGSNCPGWPRPAAIGDGSGESALFSTLNEEHAIVNGRIYYPANKPSNFTFGIACFDLENEVECGYTPVARTKVLGTNNFPNIKDVSGSTQGLATAASLSRDALLKGPWLLGNELYFADLDGNVYCAKANTTLIPCLGTYYIPTSQIQLATSGYDPTYAYGSLSAPYASNHYIMGRIENGNLYLASSTRVKHIAGNTATGPEGRSYINCLKPSTKTACWSGGIPKGTGSYSYPMGRNSNAASLTFAAINNFIHYDTTGNAKALCQFLIFSGSINSKECFDLSTGASFPPANALNFALPATVYGYGTEVHIWPRTFIPDYFNANIHCWNWQTNSSCDSATKNYFAKTSLFGNPENYALNMDENQCVWVYGNKGFLWNFDPNSLDSDGVAKPCGSSGKFIKIFQPLTYCSGPKSFHWTSVEVKNASLANFDKFIVKVLDSTNNAVLISKDLKSTNTTLVDATSIDAQTLSKPFKIEVEYTPKLGTTDKPYLEVRYNAPAPEFCFTSTHTCQQGKITNTVEAQDPFDPNKSVKAQVEVAQPLSCNIVTPPCGTPGQPACPCQTCGTASTAPCPPCGQAGQAPCPPCGQAGQPACPDGSCIPGSPNCPIVIIGGTCVPGTFNCPPRPPTGRDPLCLTGDCTTDKPKQSVAEEFKEPKVSCVRKPKPVAEEPKKVAPKPRPKPAVVAAPVAVDPNAPPPPPKPKPKPRPKPVQAKPAAEDDCD